MPAQIAAALRVGGLVLYFRHARTDFSRDDSRSTNDEDCANQRPLTEAGRDDARRIGLALRDLKVTVGRVLASPLCRTMETARLIFGRAEGARDVRGAPLPPTDPQRYAPVKLLFSTPVPAGQLLAIVSHGNPFFYTAGPPYPAEGEAVLMRPLGNDFEVVARIRVEEWAEIAPTR